MPVDFAAVVPEGVACLSCRLPTPPLPSFLPPIPPTPFPAGEGGDQGYFMQGASPLASPGLGGMRHWVCFFGCLPPLPLAYFAAPLPRRGRIDPRPALAERSSPPGKGEIFSFLMQGASPLASPGLNPGGTGAGGVSRAGGGACPAAAVPGGRAVPPPCMLDLPEPSPGGGGGRGREVRQRRGWQAAKRENFPP